MVTIQPTFEQAIADLANELGSCDNISQACVDGGPLVNLLGRMYEVEPSYVQAFLNVRLEWRRVAQDIERV